MQYESERIEYKSQLTDEIYKEVIALFTLALTIRAMPQGLTM